MEDNKQLKTSIRENVIISNFNEDDVDAFIQIHVEHLFSDSEFSRMYLAERFKYLLKYESAIGICARDIHGKMLGLIYGGPEGYKKRMNKYIMKRMAWKLLRRPYLLFSDEFLYKYRCFVNKLISKFKFRKKIVDYSLNNSKLAYTLPEPVLRLTGIAVLEEFTHLGIGEQLIKSYEKAARERNYKSIILETPRTNTRAIKFYKKLGWKDYHNEELNLDKRYFYKLIY